LVSDPEADGCLSSKVSIDDIYLLGRHIWHLLRVVSSPIYEPVAEDQHAEDQNSDTRPA
jgi:hypothetical protein